MKMIAMVILCLGLMIPAFHWKKQALMVAAGLTWLVFAFWVRSLTPTWGTWDLYEGMFWLGLAMIFLCFIEAIVLARKVPREDLAEEDEDAYIADFGKYRARLRRMRERLR